MIGVLAPAAQRSIVEEFFELFKTPWEPAVKGQSYGLLLSAGLPVSGFRADALLIYDSETHEVDSEAHIEPAAMPGPARISWNGEDIPIFGRLGLFPVAGGRLVHEGAAADYGHTRGSRPVRRVGYNLFVEVEHLLVRGQPASEGRVPTLELHIDLLRHLLQELGVSYTEVPPRPAGCRFVCCLTHDVDFYGIRSHGFDRAIAGFVARASIGTLAGLARGRRTPGEALRNFRALLSLPLVFLRALPDFWRPLDDYARADEGWPSTYFLVPFPGRNGVSPDGNDARGRAVAYDLTRLRSEVIAAIERGDEIAVHGIDAWRDAAAGVTEREIVVAVTGQASPGVRMHWLYFNTESAMKLEDAGFAYDSTCGFNDAVGYRAGTSQVFRLPGTRSLMELPLSIMDTALLYPRRMGLTADQAVEACGPIVRNADRFGGTLVINWHDRSLAPERLWAKPYQSLLNEIDRGGGAWFATARQAVDWFKWRRSIRFVSRSGGEVEVIAPPPPRGLPSADVYRYRPGADGPTMTQLMPAAEVPMEARA